MPAWRRMNAPYLHGTGLAEHGRPPRSSVYMSYLSIPAFSSRYRVVVDTALARASIDGEIDLADSDPGDFTQVNAEGEEATLLIVFNPDQPARGVLVRRARAEADGADKASPIVGALIDAMLQELHDEAANPTVLAHAALALRASLPVPSLAHASEAASGSLAAWRLDRAISYMDERLHLSVKTPAVARACGLTVNHFSRAFARATGMPPHRWLMKRRIERAQRLLRDSNRSLGDIAAACGFSEAGHLSRVFVRTVGVPPGTWRRWVLKGMAEA